MEVHTFKIDTQEVGKKTLYKGTTKRIEVNKYYSLDGSHIDEGKDIINYDKEVPVEIVERKVQYNWGSDMEPDIIERWEVKVDDKRICKDLEITRYQVGKDNKLILNGCTGCG